MEFVDAPEEQHAEEAANTTDEEPRDGQHDLAAIPEQMCANEKDSHEQGELHALLYSTSGSEQNNYAFVFHNSSVKPTRLTKFKAVFEHRDKRSAMTFLRTRRTPVIDDEFIVDTNSADVTPRIGPHFYDFGLLVGDRCGLDAVLPRSLVDHTWSANLNFNLGHVMWPKADTKKTSGSESYPGHSLKGITTTTDAGRHPVLDAPTITLKPTHRLMITMFFAWALNAMNYADIHCNPPYPEPLTRDAVNNASDILNRVGERSRTLVLTLGDMKRLNDIVRNQWVNWVNRAPDSWKRDGFLTLNMPVAITMRYGQNQNINDSAATVLDERRVWDRDHDYTHIRQFTFSLATSIRYSQVTDWQERPAEELAAVNPRLYDKPDDAEDREAVDIHTLPLNDDDGHEIPVYDQDGYRVPRRIPVLLQASYGAWIDLRRAHSLFTYDDEDPIGRPNRFPFTGYPQAYLKHYGNIQSTMVPSKYKILIDRLNDAIALPIEAEESEDDVEIILAAHHAGPALRPVCFQSYNELSHRFRDEARFHTIQLGMVTAALSGSTATTIRATNKWQQRMEQCKEKLPYERFIDKVSGPNQPQALRNEVTFTLDLHRLAAGNRNGGYIYDNVISKATRFWSHPSVLTQIRQSIIVLKVGFLFICLLPFLNISCRLQVIPQIYKWTAYPIASVIEHLWDRSQHLLDDRKPILPFLIENVAMFERILNFATTGNAQVLLRQLMDRAWLSLGCITDGLPCVSDEFIHHASFSTDTLILGVKSWPIDDKSRCPQTASKRVQVLTYGQSHYAAYEATFTVQYGIETLPSTIYSNIADMTLRRACYAMELGLRAYISDVKNLVIQGVMAEIRPHVESDDLDEKAHAVARKKALETWNAQEHPLSYSDVVLPYLLRAVVPQQRGNGELTQSAEGRQSRAWFAAEVFKQCTNSTLRRRPPFIQDGDFKPVMRAAILETTKWMQRSGLPDNDITTQIKDAIVYACDILEISHIPWSANGSASTKVMHNVYRSIGLAAPQTDPTNSIFTTQESGHLHALRTSVQMIREDPRGKFYILEIRLTGFATILHKSIAPVELSVDNAGLEKGSDIIRDLYARTIRAYDGNNPIHQLALLCALILAELAPNVFAQKDHPRPVPDDQARLKLYVAALDWSTRQRKGITQRSGFIVAGTVFFISWLDRQSPFRALGGEDVKTCNAKHGHKGLSALTLCRFGLADPVTTRVMGSARFTEDIAIKSEADLMNLHAEVTKLLRDGGEYGAYDVVIKLAGVRAANILVKRGIIRSRLPSQGLNHSLGGTKRSSENDSNTEPSASGSITTIEDLFKHSTKKQRRG
ncbi:hypothetical protein J3R83DRAFT_7741 [Lanmaoa asiatica]|nr:hypothetical protein J3R83DRAFT_7741 [Lanmaoa asiatica]